jgi:hypothetical protein
MFGLRVKSTAMSSGTKKIRSSVSELGRFMSAQRLQPEMGTHAAAN